jgi:hypothetical protein
VDNQLRIEIHILWHRVLNPEVVAHFELSPRRYVIGVCGIVGASASEGIARIATVFRQFSETFVEMTVSYFAPTTVQPEEIRTTDAPVPLIRRTFPRAIATKSTSLAGIKSLQKRLA